MTSHNNDERIARLEGVNERILVEMTDLKAEGRQTRAEMNAGLRENREEIRSESNAIRGEIAEVRREARNDVRMLIGFQLTTTLALLAVMSKGFGWV